MSDILARIAATVRERIAAEKQRMPAAQLAELARAARTPLDFRSAFAGEGIHVIAEVKKASPSRGDIAPHLDPRDVARDYLANGARALSVLTEPTFFKGRVEYLKNIRADHPTARLLMKDFFLDTYQLDQARAYGADAILVIVAMLGGEGSRAMHEAARQRGLTPLVEVHDEEELETALGFGAELIGVNNRNLKTMTTSLETTIRLARLIPPGVTLIGESGIESPSDLERLARAGCRGFLIGTSFMATGRPGKALAELIAGAKT